MSILLSMLPVLDEGIQFVGPVAVAFKLYPCWHKVQEEPSEVQIWQLRKAEVQAKQDVPER